LHGMRHDIGLKPTAATGVAFSVAASFVSMACNLASSSSAWTSRRVRRQIASRKMDELNDLVKELTTRISSLEGIVSAAKAHTEPDIEMTAGEDAMTHSRGFLLSHRIASADVVAPQLMQGDHTAKDDITEVTITLDSLCASLCQKLYAAGACDRCQDPRQGTNGEHAQTQNWEVDAVQMANLVCPVFSDRYNTKPEEEEWRGCGNSDLQDLACALPHVGLILSRLERFDDMTPERFSEYDWGVRNSGPTDDLTERDRIFHTGLERWYTDTPGVTKQEWLHFADMIWLEVMAQEPATAPKRTACTIGKIMQYTGEGPMLTAIMMKARGDDLRDEMREFVENLNSEAMDIPSFSQGAKELAKWCISILRSRKTSS